MIRVMQKYVSALVTKEKTIECFIYHFINWKMMSLDACLMEFEKSERESMRIKDGEEEYFFHLNAFTLLRQNPSLSEKLRKINKYLQSPGDANIGCSFRDFRKFNEGAGHGYNTEGSIRKVWVQHSFSTSKNGAQQGEASATLLRACYRTPRVYFGTKSFLVREYLADICYFDKFKKEGIRKENVYNLQKMRTIRKLEAQKGSIISRLENDERFRHFRLDFEDENFYVSSSDYYHDDEIGILNQG